MLKRWLWQTLPYYGTPGDDGAGDPADNAAGVVAGDGAAGGDAGAAAGEGAEGGEPAAGEAAAGSPAQQADWRDKELRRKHAQVQEGKRREQELQASLDASNALLRRVSGDAAPNGGASAVPAAGEREAPLAAAERPGERKAEVQQEAARIVAQQNFDRAAEDADTTGKQRYGDTWKQSMDTLETLGGFDPETLNNILSADDPAQVLHTLGSKPEEYQRIIDLPPHKRFAEIVKLGIPKRAAAKKPSGAPDPTEPVRQNNRGDPTALSDELDDETWYARRATQKKARFEARQGGRA